MVGPIQRAWRLLPKRPLVPLVMLVVCVNAQVDPRRATGYGGVLPIPGPTTTSPTSAGPRSETLTDQQARDLRAARGRVLYAPGHAPRDTAALRGARAPKAPCPTRVGQDRNATPIRTS